MPYITSVPDGLQLAQRCWFGLSSAMDCIMPQSSYFTLGEGISALALIFAIFALRNPRWELVLRIRGKWWMRVFWGTTALAMLAVFLGFVKQHTPIDERWLFGALQPSFFEAVAFFLFTFAACFLYFSASKLVGVLSEKSMERAYYVLISTTAKHDKDATAALLDVIFTNLEDLIKIVSGFEGIRRKTNLDTDKDRSIYFAYLILNHILGDKYIANIIAQERIDLLSNLFSFIDKYKISEAVAGDVVRQVTVILFDNPESCLYRHYDDTGIAQFKNIYSLIFGSPHMLNEFRLFEKINPVARLEISDTSRKVFLKAFETSCRTYYYRGEAYINLHYMLEGFSQLESYIDASIYARRNLKPREVLSELLDVVFFLEHTFPWIYSKAFEENKIEKDGPEHEGKIKFNGYGYHETQSLSGGYANCVIKFWEEASSLDFQTLDDFWHYGITTAVHFLCQRQVQGFEKIKAQFFKLLESRVKQNVEHGYYPAITKVAFIMLGSPIMEKPDVMYRNDFIDYIEKFLAPKLKAGAYMSNGTDKMSDALLPKIVKFDGRSKKFSYITRDHQKHLIKKLT